MSQDLVEWALSHGATLHENAEIHKDESGYMLRTRGDSEGIVFNDVNSMTKAESTRTIVSCPLTLSLSAFNAFHQCPLSRLQNEHDLTHFPPPFLEKTPFHVIGKFFLCQQYLMGEKSFWSPYISALPQPDFDGEGGGTGLGTPLFWNEEDVDWIRGTNMEWARQERLTSWTAEWEGAVGLLREGGWMGWEGITLEVYKWASTIFSSRCFVGSSLPVGVFFEGGGDREWEERVEREHQ